MQHIFNIAIDMDDERIVKAVSSRAEEEILKKLTNDVEDSLFNHRGWGSDRFNPNMRDGLSETMKDCIMEFIGENQEEILDRAGKFLAERLARTKKAREVLEGVRLD